MQRKIEDIAVPEKIEDDLVPKINGVEYVASYNLIDGLKAPTILVPGKHSAWQVLGPTPKISSGLCHHPIALA